MTLNRANLKTNAQRDGVNNNNNNKAESRRLRYKKIYNFLVERIIQPKVDSSSSSSRREQSSRVVDLIFSSMPRVLRKSGPNRLWLSCTSPSRAPTRLCSPWPTRKPHKSIFFVLSCVQYTQIIVFFFVDDLSWICPNMIKKNKKRRDSGNRLREREKVAVCVCLCIRDREGQENKQMVDGPW